MLAGVGAPFAPRRRNVLSNRTLRHAFPGYFALVMATGIVSLAQYAQGDRWFAEALFVVNVVAYVLLVVAGIARIAETPRTVARELADHVKGPSFLTIVAGTCVLGVQFAALHEWRGAALATWIASIVLWFVLIYGFFAAVTIAEPKPRLEHGLDGSWLLVTVATEAVAVLGTEVAPSLALRDVAMFACLGFFLAGAMLYVLVIGLILFRWTFRTMDAQMLTPTYWINMGAVAITTLAGARLVDVAGHFAFLAGIEHFVAGFTLFFFATATWWIPLLVIVFVWRHVHRRVPIRYDPHYWSLVFPLGMYSAATDAYARADRLDFLLPLAQAMAWVSLAAWLLTAAGLAHRVLTMGRRVSAWH
ncbi:MAG TPA: tellurite resistance/C4-dicarboxylate transporter family protein [Casimicrobiaceae bacterium]